MIRHLPLAQRSKESLLQRLEAAIYAVFRARWEVVRTPGEIHARITQPYNAYRAEIERLRRQLRRYTFYPMFYPVGSWMSMNWLPTPRAKKYVRGWEEEYDDTRAVFDIAQLAVAGFLDQLLTCRCGKWFFAKFKHQQFCSTKCRQQEFRTSERWKEYRRRKAREYLSAPQIRKGEITMANNADGIYTRKDRSGYWMHWRDAQGRRRWRKLNVRTLQQARTARAAELVRVEKSKVLGFAPPGEEAFDDIAKRFLAHQRARLTPKAYNRESGIVNAHLNKFFTGSLANIRRVDIQRYVTKRSGEVSAYSVQKELNILKHLLRLAVEWEIIPFSPGQGIKSPRVPAGRLRYLQPTELRSLLAASPDWLRAIVLLAVTTGMRRSEILGLRWLDLDMANGRILLPQTKNGDGRAVYLNQSAHSCAELRATLACCKSNRFGFRRKHSRTGECGFCPAVSRSEDA